MSCPCIRLKDNRFDGYGRQFKYDAEIKRWKDCCDQSVLLTQVQVETLKRFGGLPISEYLAGLVSLTGLEVNAENSVSKEKDFLYSVQGDFQTWFRIDTSNMMGHVRLCTEDREAALELEITSRFDEGKNQYFLNHLFCAGLGVSLVSEVGGISGGWDFLLAYLFLIRLGEVASVGLLKQYVEFRRNDFNPRGRVDIQRHIRENWPAMQGIAYVKRDAVFDVPLNHLLRHAAETVLGKWPQLIDRLDDARDMIRALRENTPTWSKNDCGKIMQDKDCLSSVRHPYFAEYYEPLRILSRALLREEGLGVYGDGDEVSGVVFNGADLWEEYLHTVLARPDTQSTAPNFSRGEYIHSNNRTGKSGIYLYKPRENENSQGHQRIYPDFRWRYGQDRPENEWDFILDAKYKDLIKDKDSAPDVDLSDRCEMAQYVMATRARLCALLFPVKNDGNQSTLSGERNWLVDGVFAGYEATVIVIPFFIPTANEFDVFERKIGNEEVEFRKRIESALRKFQLYPD